MFTIKSVMDHVQVYDQRGRFLFSADNEKEAWEEIAAYEESAA